jgi:ribosomal protein S18 acetylase RimI-like enzyme
MSLFARKDKAAKLRPMTSKDIEMVREVGQIAWSDLAMHDIGRRFKYPKRSEKIVEAYLWSDPRGCIVAEEDGKLVGSAFCHTWGKVGWVGPLEVLPTHQDHGIGKMLLRECEVHLEQRGCSVIGLETMAHLPKHLHFYMSSGYRPGATTLIMEKILRQEGEATGRAEELTLADLEGGLAAVSALSGKVNPQLDYSIEVETILRKELGHVYVIRNGADIEGLALLHTYQRGDEASYSSVKALLVDPHSPQPSQSFSQLMNRCENESLEQGKNRLLTRFPAGDLRLYELMLGRAYLLKGANIRMIKKGEYSDRGSYNIVSWAG